MHCIAAIRKYTFYILHSIKEYVLNLKLHEPDGVDDEDEVEDEKANEGGDDEGLGRALGLEVWPVGRHGLGVGQGTDLGEEVRKLAAILKTSRIHGNNGNNMKAKLVAIITP